MIIKKYFATMKQAEKFLNRLYNKYDSVTCLICPPLESGVYVFKCDYPINKVSKKYQIIELFKKDESNDLISMKLDCSLSYVVRIEKEYLKANKKINQ